jgi:hypothetical protein
MEPMQELTHPSDSQLASFLDPELERSELERLVTHLDICPACEARLEEMEPAFSAYRRWLDSEYAQVSRPSANLPELLVKMERLEAERIATRSRTWRFTPARIAWPGAIAAGAMAVAILVPWGRGSEVRAETLLARAADSAAHAARPSHLRIRTRTASFIRPATVRGEAADFNEEVAIRERFAAAHYDWQEPLNARAYLDWRHSLMRKTSQVSEVHGDSGQTEERVETRTAEGALRDASLTFDAALAPVSGRFKFADSEWVEITVAPDSPAIRPGAVAAMPPAPSREPVVTPADSGGNASSDSAAPIASAGERELDVRLAIDALNLGAGNPIEVKVEPTGDIAVTSYRLGDQAKQLRAALEQIQGVTLRSSSNRNDPQDLTAAPVDRADRILRLSQNVSFEAHFLAEMAGRFEPATEATLTPAGKTKLLELRRKHSTQMVQDLAGLRRELEEERPAFHPVTTALPADGQTPRIARSAVSMDRLVTALFAGNEPASVQAEKWRELATEFAALEGLAGAYQNRLDRIQEKP